MAQLSFHELDAPRWDDFARLMQSGSWTRQCWCMAWRETGRDVKRTGPERKAAMAERVQAGVPAGILGYLEGEPVAWCSIAPRPTYRRLGGPEPEGEVPEDVWSLVCFFRRRDLRGQGITARLLRAAVEHALEKGARVVEAYPVQPDSPSYTFMGYVPTFEAAGFRHVAMAGTRRHVMRLELR
jgi:GNAT superfamily N-acetyltransferase